MAKRKSPDLTPECEAHLREIAHKLPEALMLHTVLFFRFLDGLKTELTLDTQLMKTLLRRRVLEKELAELGFSLTLCVRGMRKHVKPIGRELNDGNNC